MATRFGATDVHYPVSGGATAALVVSDREDFSSVLESLTVTLAVVADYVPGRFYERELPAIKAVLDDVAPLDVLVIDGYVDLDPGGRAGLGRHVWDANLAEVVIGVAKRPFRAAVHAAPVLRGKATAPLYVTVIGMPLDDAANMILKMAGSSRIPDALRLVDRLARGTTRA